MDKNVRKIETTISSVHVREVKRRAETSNQANKRNRVSIQITDILKSGTMFVDC